MTTDLHEWVAAVRHGVAAAAPQAGAFAHHVQVLPTTGSTNDDVARAAVDGAPEGYAVIAAEQTAGRGRRGATWHSPATHGIYCSLLLRPTGWPSVVADAASTAPRLATLMAGVAVAQAVRDACGAVVELKWPNDVMVRGTQAGWRKLAGILAEGASEGGRLRTVVLGVGINVRRSIAPPAIATRMVALDEVVGADASAGTGAMLADLVAALLVRIGEGVSRLAAGGVRETREAWMRLAPTADGTAVSWTAAGMPQTGRARGIADDGALRVVLHDGALAHVHGGDVTWHLEGVQA